MNNIDQSSRSAAADDDGTDQIGFDTPRSGVATPQPDLHDKRLPGIMSYFGQVRTASIQSFVYSCASTIGRSLHVQAGEANGDETARTITASQSPVASEATSPCCDAETESPSLLLHESQGGQVSTAQKGGSRIAPLPTPPISLRSSMERLNRSMSSCNVKSGCTLPAPAQQQLYRNSISDVPRLKNRRFSIISSPSSTVTASNVHARHISNPTTPTIPSTDTPNFPTSHIKSEDDEGAASVQRCSSLVHLKKLTEVATIKSGPPTPTRALSAAQPSQAEEKIAPGRGSNESSSATGTQTPRPQIPGTQAPAVKGKLTIKITEARGIKKSRDPYVVAVFQRSELISGGPRDVEEDEDSHMLPPPMGGVPIQRQASDSGRPMAIPMRSRQSSNTSIHDYNTFRNRQRQSFTKPKWDAEAILYVVPVFRHVARHGVYLTLEC
jgi:serine/threonine protein kinase SCH9